MGVINNLLGLISCAERKAAIKLIRNVKRSGKEVMVGGKGDLIVKVFYKYVI